jgi:hypothetical protein
MAAGDRGMPQLERLGPERARISRGAEDGLEISGPLVARVLAWHDHMLTAHGERWAQVYLAGVLDGLAVAADEQVRQLFEETRRHLAEGEALRARLEAGREP